MRAREVKENMIYKIVLDILCDHLKYMDMLQMKTYANQYIPIAIEFYSSLTDQQV